MQNSFSFKPSLILYLITYMKSSPANLPPVAPSSSSSLYPINLAAVAFPWLSAGCLLPFFFFCSTVFSSFCLVLNKRVHFEWISSYSVEVSLGYTDCKISLRNSVIYFFLSSLLRRSPIFLAKSTHAFSDFKLLVSSSAVLANSPNKSAVFLRSDRLDNSSACFLSSAVKGPFLSEPSSKTLFLSSHFLLRSACFFFLASLSTFLGWVVAITGSGLSIGTGSSSSSANLLSFWVVETSCKWVNTISKTAWKIMNSVCFSIYRDDINLKAI